MIEWNDVATANAMFAQALLIGGCVSVKPASDANLRISRWMLCSAIVWLWTCLPAIVEADEPSGKAVDRSTLSRKVMCGYQGWFNCEGDGANLGWKHWARNRRNPFGPQNVTVDLWPDMSEYSKDERFATGFRHADGRVAEVFSSNNRATVVRHFKWMQEYGIDGAFMQRFIASHSSRDQLRNQNGVLSHAREGAKLHGRAFAVMYDLSGLKSGEVKRVQSDWRTLQQKSNITSDDTYLHHEGNPVVAVWGIGFSDDRKYSLDECLSLVQWLKSEGCTVMLGVPSFWRELRRDATDDRKLHQIIREADIISPWSVGRYQTPKQAKNHATNVWAKDRQWCKTEQLDFLPVIFPGFSWHNLHGGKLNAIPRLRGDFLWAQFAAARQTGCDMIYVAMFDEVDEGTAIFKCTSDPPAGAGVNFLGYDDLPSDHYLKMVGEAGRVLRGESDLTDPISN